MGVPSVDGALEGMGARGANVGAGVEAPAGPGGAGGATWAETPEFCAGPNEAIAPSTRAAATGA